MAVAVGKDVLHEHGGPPGAEHGRHEKGLGVGGKTGVGGGADGSDGPQPLPAAEAGPPLAALHLAPRLVEGGGDGGQVAAVHVLQLHLPPGGGHSGQVSGRGDPVGHDGMYRIVGLPPPLHAHRGGPRPPDGAADGPQIGLEVLDLRLPGGVDDDGLSLRPAGGQDGVFRGPHAGQAQGDLPARHVVCLAAEPAPLLPDHSPQSPQGG